MTTANTDSRYGSIQKSSHGLTAVLILIPMGLIANALMRKTTGIAPFLWRRGGSGNGA